MIVDCFPFPSTFCGSTFCGSAVLIDDCRLFSFPFDILRFDILRFCGSPLTIALSLLKDLHIRGHLLKKVLCFLRHFLCLLCHKKTPGDKGFMIHPDYINALGL